MSLYRKPRDQETFPHDHTRDSKLEDMDLLPCWSRDDDAEQTLVINLYTQMTNGRCDSGDGKEEDERCS